jgi:ribosome-associated heat shock protein Hsp15
LSDAPAPPDRQRIDKWLWHARVVRTRSAAAALVGGGLVRLNGERAEASSRAVRPGDVVTIALDRAVRILKVRGFAERRGSATEASVLFEDLTPAITPEPRPAAGARDPGSGRPTKRDRRALDHLKEPGGFD